MKTQVLSLDPRQPDPDKLRQAAEVIRSGGLVAFPTETVYGLGANALDDAAVQRIFAAKGRPSNNPIIVHVADIGQARALVAQWPDRARQLASKFWPGPLTLVLSKRDIVPRSVTAGGTTVGVRMPKHPVALALLKAASLPIAAPSANRSTELSPTRAEHVLASLDGRINLVLDGGPCQVGLESTVLDLSSDSPRLLRPGMISREELEAEIGTIVLAGSVRLDQTLPAPGLMEKHYSPRTLMELVGANWKERGHELRREGFRVVLLLLDEVLETDTIQMPRDPHRYAERLYAVLHELDQRNFDRILVQTPPDDSAWLAIQDRLRRAARR